MAKYTDEEVAEYIYKELKRGTEDQVIGKIQDVLVKKMGFDRFKAKRIMNQDDFIFDVLQSYKKSGGKLRKESMDKEINEAVKPLNTKAISDMYKGAVWNAQALKKLKSSALAVAGSIGKRDFLKQSWDQTLDLAEKFEVASRTLLNNIETVNSLLQEGNEREEIMVGKRTLSELEELAGISEAKQDMARIEKAVVHNMEKGDMKALSKLAKDVLKTNGQKDFDRIMDLVGQMMRK